MVRRLINRLFCTSIDPWKNLISPNSKIILWFRRRKRTTVNRLTNPFARLLFPSEKYVFHLFKNNSKCRITHVIDGPLILYLNLALQIGRVVQSFRVTLLCCLSSVLLWYYGTNYCFKCKKISQEGRCLRQERQITVGCPRLVEVSKKTPIISKTQPMFL